MLSASTIARTEEAWDGVVTAARKEGRVVLYSAFVGLAAHQDLKREFEAAYGITVDILEARASEVRERIRIEQAAGRFAADVSENGRTTTTLQIDQDHVFEPFGPLPSLGHGARRAVTVEVNGNLMRAEVPATARLGEEVMLTIDERAAWALNA